MHCDHCFRRYERESVAVEAVCVVSLNYGHCDTATRNCATEWSLRVVVKKKGDIIRSDYFSNLLVIVNLQLLKKFIIQ